MPARRGRGARAPPHARIRAGRRPGVCRGPGGKLAHSGRRKRADELARGREPSELRVENHRSLRSCARALAEPLGEPLEVWDALEEAPGPAGHFARVEEEALFRLPFWK